MLHRSIPYRLIVGLGAVALAVLLFAVGSAPNAGGQTAPGLGVASSYAVLGASTVTNTGFTIIGGDLGVSPGTAVTGFPPGIVTGATHSADTAAAQAQVDVTTAYNALAGESCTLDLTGQDLGGMTLTAGVYCFSSSAELTGQLTLDAEGNAAVQQSFASFLKSLGNGTALVYPDRDEGEDVIRFPPEMCCDGDTLEDLIKEVYGDLAAFTDAVARSDFITKRAILTPRNADVDLINKVMVDTHDLTTPGAPPARLRRCLSADSVVEGEGVQPGLYPTDFLNKLEFSGVPPHEMHLREGCPIILLRNMPGGLANGTRLIVTKLTGTLIKAEVATGPLKGKTALIPRLSITPSDSQNWPFTLLEYWQRTLEPDPDDYELLG